eukprot:gnl/MRDRNA2_/MRDRNA2_97119_c0_seq1.p1 gnl/MRDRNA2_/MRDRNA2_97119_c0~~gnl/MRDRNA2_/MRDRNA2_97119_c0_seq1.p1  ORF type:complete len:258 (-),score=52.09 gnl/MRDRNA2_/MRDRNA2_97119_c0_seq1:245-1018(-)
MGQCKQIGSFNPKGLNHQCRSYVCQPELPIKHLGSSTLENVAQQLVIASRRGDLNGVRMALECGKRLKASSSSKYELMGFSPGLCVQAHPNPWNFDVDYTGGSGTTALMYAAREGHYHVVGFLLEARANPHAADLEGMRPLHFAALSGSPEVCKCLIDAGAATTEVDDQGQRAYDWLPVSMLGDIESRRRWESLLLMDKDLEVAVPRAVAVPRVERQECHQKDPDFVGTLKVSYEDTRNNVASEWLPKNVEEAHVLV